MKTSTTFLCILSVAVSLLTVESFSALQQPASFLARTSEKRLVKNVDQNSRIGSTSLSKLRLNKSGRVLSIPNSHLFDTIIGMSAFDGVKDPIQSYGKNYRKQFTK